MNPKSMVAKLYDTTLNRDFSKVSEILHEEYRSANEIGENSPSDFIRGTKKMLDEYKILERSVLFLIADKDYVGIVHEFKVIPRLFEVDEPITSLRSDFYRISDGKFIEHWGIPAI